MNCSPTPRAVLLGALAVTSLSAPTAAQTRPFTAEDMLDIVRISGPVAVSPAGDRLAFVLPDLRDEWNVGERQQRGSVHILRLDGAAMCRSSALQPKLHRLGQMLAESFTLTP